VCQSRKIFSKSGPVYLLIHEEPLLWNRAQRGNQMNGWMKYGSTMIIYNSIEHTEPEGLGLEALQRQGVRYCVYVYVCEHGDERGIMSICVK